MGKTHRTTPIQTPASSRLPSPSPQSLAWCDMVSRSEKLFGRTERPGLASRPAQRTPEEGPWVLSMLVLEWRSLPCRSPVQIQAELRPESGGDLNWRCLLVSLTEWLVSTEVQFPGHGVAPFILTPVASQPSGTRQHGASPCSTRLSFCRGSGFRAGPISEGRPLDDFFLSTSSS